MITWLIYVLWYYKINKYMIKNNVQKKQDNTIMLFSIGVLKRTYNAWNCHLDSTSLGIEFLLIIFYNHVAILNLYM